MVFDASGLTEEDRVAYDEALVVMPVSKAAGFRTASFITRLGTFLGLGGGIIGGLMPLYFTPMPSNAAIGLGIVIGSMVPIGCTLAFEWVTRRAARVAGREQKRLSVGTNAGIAALNETER